MKRDAMKMRLCSVALGFVLNAVLDPAFADGFSAAPSMHAARFGHTATLLSDGRVLVAGGGTISSTLATAEIYDPASNTWTATGAMSQAREYHTATLLTSGKVLVVGGDDLGTTLRSAEVFDPATGLWSPTSLPISARTRHTATLLPSGNVMVAFGGTGNNDTNKTATVEQYSPSTNAWSSLGSAPGNQVRSLHQAALTGNIVVAFGGIDNTGTVLSVTSGYSLQIGSFIGPFPPMNAARFYFTSNVLASGEVIAIGGANTSTVLNSVESYVTTSNAWTTLPAMSSARYGHTSSMLSNGNILVAGGVASFASNAPTLATAEIYYPTLNAWASTSSMITSRAQHTSTPMNSGRTLVCGGQTGVGASAIETATCEMYVVDPIYKNGFEIPSN